VRTLAVAAAALVLAPAAFAYVGAFQTPAGRAVCELDRPGHEGSLLCRVEGGGPKLWSMRETGAARVRVVMSNAPSDVPVLRYGQTWRRLGFTCVSRRAGLTCRNRSAHGFFLSPTRQRIF
jgi:hypothetical protein